MTPLIDAVSEALVAKLLASTSFMSSLADRLESNGALGCKGPATRNDFVNGIVNDARAGAIFATLKAIVDDEKSTISSTISLRVAWPLLIDVGKCPAGRLQDGH